MKTVLFNIIMCLFICLASCSSDNNSVTEEKEQIVEKQEDPKIENWTYSESTDEMSGDITYYATCLSPEVLKLKYDYDKKGSRVSIHIRNSSGKNEVIVEVTKGTIPHSLYSDESVRLKFDNEEPLIISYNSAANGNTKVIFLDQTENIIKKIKAAKKLKLEISLFNEGTFVVNFDTSNLKWDN